MLQFFEKEEPLHLFWTIPPYKQKNDKLIRVCIFLLFIAKLSLTFSSSLTELITVSANPATRHPEKYKFLLLQPKHEKQSSLWTPIWV